LTYGQWVLALVRIEWEIERETPVEKAQLHRTHIERLKRARRRQDLVNDARR
jgi:hypothetical protein